MFCQGPCYSNPMNFLLLFCWSFILKKKLLKGGSSDFQKDYTALWLCIWGLALFMSKLFIIFKKYIYIKFKSQELHFFKAGHNRVKYSVSALSSLGVIYSKTPIYLSTHPSIYQIFIILSGSWGNTKPILAQARIIFVHFIFTFSVRAADLYLL